MSQRTLYLAAYDVSSPSRLRKALRVMRQYSTGGQKSVFECFLTAAERDQVVLEISEVLNLTEDRFLLIRLDPRVKVQTLGIAVLPTDPAYFYVG